ncbi:uncharacterized protein LOC116847973 [Odontomachus brunneus]|uniref:uncharacterized protein LOC116847973 n=1 Tax=Odontomachus brunneus TaxID=486640 RepID=UPI0013F1DC28|nr:uncharacterized protein LOC116847973 [Odontomachus brunneus]
MYCSAGEESCAWRRAEAAETVKNFTHDPPLTETIQKMIKKIYEDLSKNDLLERCLDGNTQNNNESYNGLWHFAPKHLHCGLETIEIANYLAVSIFNEGYYKVFLKVFRTMGVVISLVAKQFVDKRDDKRLRIAERKHHEVTKETRIANRKAQAALNEFYEEEEDNQNGSNHGYSPQTFFWRQNG